MDGAGLGGRRAGPTRNVISFVLSSGGRRDRLFLSFVFFPFVYLSLPSMGERRKGRPTRIDYFDLGQDTVM